MTGLTARKGPRTLIGLLAAIGLVATLAMPVMAGENWATVTGYADGTPENNHPDTWGENCEDAGVQGGDTWVLPELPDDQAYSLVVVKAGSEQSAEKVNTLFANPSAGQTVWADSDGSGDFSEGDKGISHVIVCTEDEGEEPQEPEETPVDNPEETPVDNPEETPREDTAGGTPTPAPELPDTAMGDIGQLPTTVLSLVLLGALGAMVYVRAARQR